MIIIILLNSSVIRADPIYEEFQMQGNTSYSKTVTNPKHSNAIPSASTKLMSDPMNFNSVESIKFDYSLYAYLSEAGDWMSCYTYLYAYFKDASTDDVIAYAPNWTTTSSILDSVGTNGRSRGTFQKSSSIVLSLDTLLADYDCSNAIFVIEIISSGYVSGETSHTAAVSGSISNVMLASHPHSYTLTTVNKRHLMSIFL